MIAPTIRYALAFLLATVVAAMLGCAKTPSPHNAAADYRLGLAAAKLHHFKKAMAFWVRAADAGDRRAARRLGQLYADGTGITRNVDQALLWFRRSAKQGDAKAMARIGDIYANGLGGKPDYDQALIWFAKSAAAGDDAAMRDIGELARSGRIDPAERCSLVCQPRVFHFCVHYFAP